MHGRRVLLPMMSTAVSSLLHLWFLGFLDLEGIFSRILQTYCALSFVILGLRIASDVLIGKSTWDALFQPPNFFSKYKYMISPVFVCLNVTLRISSCGLYLKLNVHLKFDTIKICFGSVVFYWWSVCVKNTLKYSRWMRRVKQFTCEAKILNQLFGCFPWHWYSDFFCNCTSKGTTNIIAFVIILILI